MLFSILATDRPGQSALRAGTREAHLNYLGELGAAVVHGGPLLNAEGGAIGSLLVIEAPDAAAAGKMAAADPYAIAGLFESVSINAHRLVIRDGKRVG